MNKSLLSTLACSLVLAACSTTAQKPVASTEQPVSAAQAASAPVAAPSLSAAELEAQKLKAQREELAKKSVYFAFDKFSVEAKYRDVVKQQADFLNGHANDAVTVEGNADERGSREYNLALGQKRAESVRKALVLQGVPDARIEAVSFGSEKPRASCAEERCWAENRRVDFQHKDK